MPAPPADRAPTPPRYELVQALRALAALTVAFGHIAHDAQAGDRATPGLARVLAWLPWDSGVDVFFVVSGFVIAVSSRRLFATQDGPKQFLVRRLARIVPIYWAMTLLFLVAATLLPGTVHANLGGPWYILAGFLFFPAARPDGVVQPPLGLGWTLNDEMFFYLVFAPFLRLPRTPAVLAVAVALGLLVGLGQVATLPGVALATWANPLVLEFCAGLLLALPAGRLVLPGAVRLLLAALAVALLHLGSPDWPRVVAAGLPALLLVAAAGLTRPASGRAHAGLSALSRLGDASYALYLVHPFVMRAGDLLWAHLGQPGGVAAYVLASLLVAQIAALAIHAWFERPATKAARAILTRAVG